MPEVTRWRPDAEYMSFSGCENGSWVAWEDYDALRTELETVTAERDELKNQVESLQREHESNK